MGRKSQAASHAPRATREFPSEPVLTVCTPAGCRRARRPCWATGSATGSVRTTPTAGGDMREVLPRSTCSNFRFRRRPARWTEPPEPDRPGVKHIALTRNKYAIVDATDFAELNRWKWTAYYTCGKWYAGRTERGRCVLMHRQIMNPPKGMVVDHKNRNGLDNTRDNLRIGTYGQNNCNRRPRGKTSQYKCVSYDKRRNKYRATAWKDGRSVHVGHYDDEIEAARAADRKNYEFNGEFAYLNFPDEIHRNLTTEPQSPQRQRAKKGKGTRKKAKKAATQKPGRRPRRKRGGEMEYELAQGR